MTQLAKHSALHWFGIGGKMWEGFLIPSPLPSGNAWFHSLCSAVVGHGVPSGPTVPLCPCAFSKLLDYFFLNRISVWLQNSLVPEACWGIGRQSSHRVQQSRKPWKWCWPELLCHQSWWPVDWLQHKHWALESLESLTVGSLERHRTLWCLDIGENTPILSPLQCLCSTPEPSFLGSCHDPNPCFFLFQRLDLNSVTVLFGFLPLLSTTVWDVPLSHQVPSPAGKRAGTDCTGQWMCIWAQIKAAWVRLASAWAQVATPQPGLGSKHLYLCWLFSHLTITLCCPLHLRSPSHGLGTLPPCASLLPLMAADHCWFFSGLLPLREGKENFQLASCLIWVYIL